MNWLVHLNKTLGAASVLLFVSAGLIAYASHSNVSGAAKLVPPPQPPQSRFVDNEKGFAALDGPLLALRYVPPTAHLPNLRDEIVYYGVDGRPDGDADHPIVHIGFRGSSEVFPVKAHAPQHLHFVKETGSYSLPQDNSETNLWFTCSPEPDGRVTVSIAMRGPDGQPIATPTAHAHFTLKGKGTGKPIGHKWELGKHRVDTSLLSRMHGRWCGSDLFLIDHGGADFEYVTDRYRLDFGAGDDLYSCFVKEGDSLVWIDDQWCEIEACDLSRGVPLLHVKKVEEKVMLFELWDGDGRHRLPLSLMRSKDNWMPDQLKMMLRFVAAKTWSQFVLMTGQERLTVSSHDWLLLADGGWKLLESVDDIDDYVAGRQTGELLILDGLARREGKQLLRAHLYNTARTDKQILEIPLTPQSGPVRAKVEGEGAVTHEA